MKNKKDIKKKAANFDFGAVLLITGALANVPLWIGAFVSTDAQGPVVVWIRDMALPVLDSLAAVTMGFTVAFGLVYVVSHLGKMKPIIETKVRGKDEYKTSPNYRFYGALTSIVLLLSISVALLSPFELMKLSSEKTLYLVLSERWAGWWSIGRVVAADLALGAIALVHGVHLGAEPGATAKPAPATGAGQSKSTASRTSSKPARSAAEMRTCEVKGCGVAFRWPNGKGAHMKKYHPELCIPKGLPIDVSYQKVDK